MGGGAGGLLLSMPLKIRRYKNRLPVLGIFRLKAIRGTSDHQTNETRLLVLLLLLFSDHLFGLSTRRTIGTVLTKCQFQLNPDQASYW